MTETGSRFPAGPAGGTGRLAALDGIRALAALAVLVYHVAVETGAALHDGFLGALLSRGDVAVPVFFTLSGFLLYLPHARAVIEGTAAPRAGAYLLRRALRILPAYWLVVAVALPLWSPEHVTDAATWLKLLLLVHVYDPAPWWSGLGPAGLAQMWSLCVETAFYLVLPLLAAALAWFAARKGADPGRRARRLLTALAAISALSYLWTLLVYYPSTAPTWSPGCPARRRSSPPEWRSPWSRCGRAANRTARPPGPSTPSAPRPARCGWWPDWLTRSRPRR